MENKVKNYLFSLIKTFTISQPTQNIQLCSFCIQIIYELTTQNFFLFVDVRTIRYEATVLLCDLNLDII